MLSRINTLGRHHKHHQKHFTAMTFYRMSSFNTSFPEQIKYAYFKKNGTIYEDNGRMAGIEVVE
jgi:hypothetical protein